MSNSITSPFGELPSDWVYQPVVNYVEFLTGPAFDSSKFNTDRFGARLVRGINLTRGATRWAEEKTKYWNVNLEELKKFQLAEMDILIGMDGSLVGKNYAYLKKSDLPALLVQRVARLRAKEQLDSKYLYYMYGTDSWVDYVEIVKTSSGIPHISNGDIKNFLFPFPPLPEQKKIAAILTSVDDVIEKTQAQIDKLKDLKTGMMQELLTRGVGVDGKPHTEFKDSLVGRIPKGWEVVKLGDKASLIPGFAFKSTDFVANGVPLIRMGNLYNNKLDLTRAPKYLPFDYIEKHPKFAVREGDIVFSMTGTSGKEDYGFAVQVPNGTKSCLLNQRVAKVIAGENAVNNFLLHLMRSRLFLDEIYAVGTGTKQANLSSANILNVVLPFPSLGEQTAISKVLDSIEGRVLVVAKKLEKLKLKKKALMQDLLTGKKRVKVDG
ncbi:restriction endonuclease subunit S [Vibrio algarum]|uniref:Restriction endonuclease subunit S n=1 Tax=Vibrio algarum TaxID=3020714 RepID=A0ABT4YT03_9VIBR|nr:restriction endonuclease subunit S [Vibrio sp. KJ40-1]MDB1124681.1 restriction endonuclease subunit S [Vibrio sp. KJ40-1]